MNTNVSRLYRRRIGEILVNQGILSTEQLDEALAIQKKTGDLLGVILQDLGLVGEADIAKTICIQYQLPFITLANYEFDARLVKLFPLEFLTAHKILPFDKIGDTLLLMVAEVPPDKVLAEIPKLTKLNAALYVGYASELDKFLSGTGPKPTAEKAAAADQAKAPPEERVLIQRVVDEDEDGSGEDETVGAGQTLAFGADAKSFLAELDSTWDQIFPGGPQEDAEKSDD